MTYSSLLDFIANRMSMSHIYQPVMLMDLLKGGGVRSISDIAKTILGYDQSQIEYYEKITRDMVGRVLRNRGIVTKEGCIFCEMAHDRIIDENELAYVIRDGFPVTPLHTLVIPKRHVATYFDLGQSEINACNELLRKTREFILEKDSAVSGFNIGINNGENSGQTIVHCHIHLIPRRKGDVENPRGGVRHLIPGKGYY